MSFKNTLVLFALPIFASIYLDGCRTSSSSETKDDVPAAGDTAESAHSPTVTSASACGDQGGTCVSSAEDISTCKSTGGNLLEGACRDMLIHAHPASCCLPPKITSSSECASHGGNCVTNAHDIDSCTSSGGTLLQGACRNVLIHAHPAPCCLRANTP